MSNEDFREAAARASRGYATDIGKAERGLVWAQQEIERLEAELGLARQDAAFYKCCALSGEVPEDGVEPSASSGENQFTERERKEWLAQQANIPIGDD